MGSARTGWFSLVAFVGSTLLVLGSVEIGMRLIHGKKLGIEAGIGDPHFHHRLPPNHDTHYYSNEFDVTIHTNSRGLRGPDPVMPKPKDRIRILMLGDSFTFGFPVRDDETFAHLIEQGLQAKGYPVEVVNGGVSSYSPLLEYILLRDELLALEPDIVMVWYDRADLQDDAQYEKNLLFNARGEITGADPQYVYGHFDRWGWVQGHSLLAAWYNRKILRTVDKFRILGFTGYMKMWLGGQRAKVAIARLKTQQRAEDLAMFDRFILIRPTSTPELLDRYWPISARYLRMMRDLLAQRGVPMVLAEYPNGVSIGPDQWGHGRTYWGFEEGRVYDDAPARDLFTRFAASEGLPLILTSPSMQAAAASQVLYYDQDGHMTPAGHRVVADHALHDAAFFALLDARRAGLSRATVRSGSWPTVASPPERAPGRGLGAPVVRPSLR